MLPSSQRFSLRKHPDFFEQAHKMRGSFFSVFYQASDTTQAQGVCVVTKKNFPTAVARNKIKRQVRAVLAPLLNHLHNILLVVIVYQPLKNPTQRKEMQEVIERISG